jgi:hypothetical protein
MIDFIGIVLVLSSAAPAPMVAPPPVFDEALQALGAGDRALAAKKFSAACGIAPVGPAACWNAGVLLREQGQYAAAADAFERFGAAVPPKQGVDARIEAVRLRQLAKLVGSDPRKLQQAQRAELVELLRTAAAVDDGATLQQAAQQAVRLGDRELMLLAAQLLVRAGRMGEGCALAARVASRGALDQQCARAAEHAKLVSQGLAAAEQQRWADAARALDAAWQLAPREVGHGLVQAYALVQSGDYGRALEVLAAVQRYGNSRQSARAGELLRTLTPLADAAARARAESFGAPTAAPTMDSEFGRKLAALEEELNEVRAQESAALDEARERQAECERIKTEIGDAEQEARSNDEQAADFDRQAADYASGNYGAGGPVGAAMAQGYANDYRSKAQEARDRARQLQQQLEDKGCSEQQ